MGLVKGGDETKNTSFLVLLGRGRAGGNWRPHFHPGHSLAHSPPWLGRQCSSVSSFCCLPSQSLVSGVAPCPSWLTASCVLMRNAAVRVGGWGVEDWGLGLPACVEGAVILFYSSPRPHLHGCGPARLRGPRLPFPDHTQGPSRVRLLQAEGPRAALLGRQCESWENRRGKGMGLGWEYTLIFHLKGKFEAVD